jgi:hypothetical protein
MCTGFAAEGIGYARTAADAGKNPFLPGVSLRSIPHTCSNAGQPRFGMRALQLGKTRCGEAASRSEGGIIQ